MMVIVLVFTPKGASRGIFRQKHQGHKYRPKYLTVFFVILSIELFCVILLIWPLSLCTAGTLITSTAQVSSI